MIITKGGVYLILSDFAQKLIALLFLAGSLPAKLYFQLTKALFSGILK